MSLLDKASVARPARRLLEQCLGLREGENLLVITDTRTVAYGEIFALIGRELGAEVVMTVMDPRSRHGEEPPPTVAAAMKAADAIVAPTTFLVNHNSARLAASAAGARLIFMPDVCDEVFLDGSLDIDFAERKVVIDQIARLLDHAKQVRVRSPRGTDLRMTVASKKAVPQSGICHEPGTISPLPCIEVAIAPRRGHDQRDQRHASDRAARLRTRRSSARCTSVSATASPSAVPSAPPATAIWCSETPSSKSTATSLWPTGRCTSTSKQSSPLTRASHLSLGTHDV